MSLIPGREAEVEIWRDAFNELMEAYREKSQARLGWEAQFATRERLDRYKDIYFHYKGG